MAKKRKLRQELSKFAHKTEKPLELISGALGIYIGGKQYVDIPTRPGYVFVRLRNNISELIQAHNQTVSPIYDLPVLVVWNHNRYEIYGRDSEQYGSYWETSSSFLPKHGFQHEFDPDNNGGGDLVFVHGEQFYPMMTFPSGTDGANTVLIAPYRYFYQGLWRYTGNTGVGDLLALGPTGGNNAKLLLVGVTSATGNPFIKQGSEFSEGITGAAALTQFVPTSLTPIDEIPGAIIRLVTGTETITWANIYDARQYMGILQAGSGTAGASTFLGLADTPNSYSGQADKLLVINSAENAIEFRTNTGTSGSPYTDVLQVQITGSVNNLNPIGMSTALVLELISDGNATYTISGIAGGTNGRILYVNNNSPFQTCILIFDNENLSSSPNNRFYFSIDKIILGPQEGIILIYDGISNNGWNIFGEHRQRGQWNLVGVASRTLTGTYDDYNQSIISDVAVIMFSGTVSSTLRGLNPIDAINTDGKILLINNIGTTLLTLEKESPSSTYRFAFPADLVIPPNGGASIRYDYAATRWRPLDFTITGSSGGAADFLSLTDTPDSYSGQADKLVVVNAAANALEFRTNTGSFGGGGGGQIGIYGQDEAVGLGTGTTLNVVGNDISLSISGTVLTLAHTNPTGTPHSFLDLTDTPDSYSGQGSKYVAVNSGATALEFVSASPGGGGGSGVMAWDEGVPLGTGTVFNFRGDNIVATISGTVVDVYVTGSSGGISTGSANHAYYTYAAAILEPLAIEALQSGAFSYIISGSSTKIGLSIYWTRIGSAGRLDMRDVRNPLPLRGVTVTGLDTTSTAIFIDPNLPTYTNAYTTYCDRLQTIYETAPLFVALVAPSTSYTLLPGPYGSIITSITNFDFTWIIFRPYGTTLGWNIMNEIGDTGSTDYQRLAHGLHLPISKNVVSSVASGAERSAAVGLGGITYFNCPASWGKVTDSNTYAFRDDFMGASLDTATKWNRTVSTVGNIEIQTTAGLANWCKVIGNGSWGANGIISQTNVSRAAGKIFMCDVRPPAYDGSAFCNLLVGWHDGAGVSYTDLSHGIDFTGGAGPTYLLNIFENGNARGAVGTGYTPGAIYRVKITLESGGANTAKYEIQGGSEYAVLGGASWTDITPGTTSSSTTPVYAGAVQLSANAAYISDVKLY